MSEACSRVSTWLVTVLRELATPKGLDPWRSQLWEDALSIAMIKALQIAARDGRYFVSRDYLKNWLRQTARWAMIDESRRQKRTRTISFGSETQPEIPDTSVQHVSRPWSVEMREAVLKCLSRLPKSERLLLTSYYFDHLTDAEVAIRVFQVPAAIPSMNLRIWRQRQKALARLRQLLEKRGISLAA